VNLHWHPKWEQTYFGHSNPGYVSCVADNYVVLAERKLTSYVYAVGLTKDGKVKYASYGSKNRTKQRCESDDLARLCSRVQRAILQHVLNKGTL
ncbi:hypothetical protein TIFTF001_040245, partial [Ficus carica]